MKQFLRIFSGTNLLIVVLIVVSSVLLLVISRTRSHEPETLLLRTPVERENDELRNALLTSLEALENLKLESTLFTSAVFQDLVDFSKDLTPRPVGRDNPFAPLEE